MLRTAWGWGLVGVLGLVGASSCSSRDAPSGELAAAADGKRGNVELGLVPVSGISLNTVHYLVTSSNSPPQAVAEGDLPTAGSASDLTFGLSLPIGTGYTLSLSAASAESSAVTCGGSFTPFDVTPNGLSTFKVVLTCHDDRNGAVSGGTQVVTDACPRLVFDYLVATPALVQVGASASVSVEAHDLDVKPIAYTWQGNGASFAPSTGASTTLTCSFPQVDMPVTVTASNGECTKSFVTRVSCVTSDGCGNGVLDPGESCDKGIIGSQCPADCIVHCGDGVIISPIEDCDPANTDNCGPTCKFRSPVCGDGFLTTVGPNPEQCDGNKLPPGTPATKKCSGQCTLFDPIIECGNGLLETGEECDDTNAGSATCSSSCNKISTPECVACENAGDCFESVDNCQGVAAPFSIGDKSKCFDVMRCIEQSNCFDGTGTLGKCYCGSLNTTQCGAAPFTGVGSPDGACVSQIKAGFPAFTSNTQVIAGLVASNFPSGAAMKRLSCQKGANSAACLGVCGFSAGGPAFP